MHETLYISIDEFDWSFCKTARKPYDLLVCACLIATHEILGYDVSSDGDLEDWKPAINFYFKTVYDFSDTYSEEFEKIVETVLPKFLIEEMR